MPVPGAAMLVNSSRLGAVVLALGLASCGGDDPGPSRATYVRGANAICRDLNATARRDLAAADTATGHAKAYARFVPAAADGVRRLARLEPPDRLAARHRELVGVLERQVGALRRLRDALRRRDRFAANRFAAQGAVITQRSDALFRRLGLRDCGSGGRASG
jgi:hypothetical protein